MSWYQTGRNDAAFLQRFANRVSHARPSQYILLGIGQAATDQISLLNRQDAHNYEHGFKDQINNGPGRPEPVPEATMVGVGSKRGRRFL